MTEAEFESKIFFTPELSVYSSTFSSGKGKSSAFDLIMLIRNSIILQKTVLGSRLKKIKDQFLSGPVTSSVLGISVGIEIAIWSDLGNLQSGVLTGCRVPVGQIFAFRVSRAVASKERHLGCTLCHWLLSSTRGGNPADCSYPSYPRLVKSIGFSSLLPKDQK